MRFLVTGGEGFIGQHLKAELMSHGHEVRVADWGPSHYRAFDLSRPGVFARILGTDFPDRVVHLAAQVGREFGEQDVTHTITSNATMTALIARVCGEANIPVTYVSTSEIYGDQGEETCYEYGVQYLPHNLYGLSKRWGEEACQLYAPVDLQVLRPSMPYGPGAPPGRGRRAMDNFIWHAQHNRPIVVHAGAERSWCWIGDMVRAFRIILEHNMAGIWNVGRDDRNYSLYALAADIIRMTNSRSEIEEIAAPSNQTVIKRLSTRRLRDMGWEPEVELEEGLQHMIEWISNFDASGRAVMKSPPERGRTPQ